MALDSGQQYGAVYASECGRYHITHQDIGMLGYKAVLYARDKGRDVRLREFAGERALEKAQNYAMEVSRKS